MQLLSIVRFLTEKKELIAESVEGRAKPFEIIYVDDKRIVLASNDISASDRAGNFHQDAQFELCMSFSVNKNKLLKRKIFVESKVENVYKLSSDSNSECFSLRYENLKEEDLRFIYERINGKSFL